MATKRQAVAQLTTEDVQLIAEAAEKGGTIKNFNEKDLKRIKRGVRILRTVKGAQ